MTIVDPTHPAARRRGNRRRRAGSAALSGAMLDMTGPGQHPKPPGWEQNPSTWPARLPIVAVALVGFGIATYLAL